MDQNIFISYRLGDSGGYAERIYERLQDYFGVNRVFMSVTNFGVSEDFRDAIYQAISSCKIVIVLIGPTWHSATDEMGRKRLDDPHDFVRAEIQAALDSEVVIVPVVVNGGKMPTSKTLSYDLDALTLYPSVEIRHRHFDADMSKLVAVLERRLGVTANTDPERQKYGKASWMGKWRWLIFVPILILIVYIGYWYILKSDRVILLSQAGKLPVVTTVNAMDMPKTETATPKAPTQTAAKARTSTPTTSPTKVPTITFTFTPIPTATEASLEFEIIDSFSVQMILIPKGQFIMGTDRKESWDAVSQPARSVNLDTFYIDKYEVSNSQYAICVSNGICEPPLSEGSKTRYSYFGNPEYAQYPVVYVTWQDAQTYCSWRGGRLPNEAEWEKAARGSRSFDFPWGDNPIDCQHANFRPSDDCEGDTIPVNSLQAGSSPFGVFNMSGNVQEWVGDWYQSYPGGDPNATKKYGNSYRVIRGGAYFDGSNMIQVTTREGQNPETAQSYNGFRCMIELSDLP